MYFLAKIIAFGAESTIGLQNKGLANARPINVPKRRWWAIILVQGFWLATIVQNNFFYQIAISIIIRIYKESQINEYEWKNGHIPAFHVINPKNVLQLVRISPNFKISLIAYMSLQQTNVALV